MNQYHNKIKKIYIDKLAGENLLDLACGRGGDLRKWKDNKNIKYVLGYDINERSISEANTRLKSLNFPKSKKVVFKELDLSANVLNCKTKFDTITSFFAFHYFFKNKTALKSITSSIDNCSKSGTKLILALFDGDKINELAEKSIYKNWTITKQAKKSGIFGNEILVYLKKTILDTPEVEYIVPPKILEKELLKIGFVLIESKTFAEVLPNSQLKPEEKKFSELNRIYVFEKNNIL
jgi:ubiquinone/menaquinone biosynthesis C-methylase UbiE